MTTNAFDPQTRRHALGLLGAGLVAGLGLFRPLPAAAKPIPITIYKSPWCGCCGLWTEHLMENGFDPKVVMVEDTQPVRARYGVPEDMASCHTALVGGYAVEGHVPASTIKRLMAERPKVVGIAVPGMPNGAPGMPTDEPEPYNVIAFSADGGRRLYEQF